MDAPPDFTASARFGAPMAAIVQNVSSWQMAVPCPWLGGCETEPLLQEPAPGPIRNSGRFVLAGHPPWVAGAILATPGAGGLDTLACGIYRELFDTCANLNLCRIWHYVPAINDASSQLENYRAFCMGRARAFEQRFGSAAAPRHMPASSAVGCRGDSLVLYFLASSHPVEHFENPVQTPAWQYPPEHGPRPPSFARATRVNAPGATHVFIAGTASIRGHLNVSPSDVLPQLECTQQNLRALGEVLGMGGGLQTPTGASRHWKIYLRHAGDREMVASRIDRGLFRPEDSLIWLNAEVCREELDIEIEATFRWGNFSS